jgi:glycosyltransferase involved in cell wall biosynthesis
MHEAMAAGLPVVGFEGAGGGPEAFLPDAGITAPYLDVDALARAVADLVEDESRRRAMGEVGRRRVSERYLFADYVARLVREMAQVAPEQLLQLQTPPARPIATRGKLFFTAPVWSLSGVNTFAETLVNYLNAAGWNAEIVLTRGRFGPSVRPGGGFYDRVREYLPNARHRFLQPADLSDAAHVEALRSFLEAQGPCVLVPGFDYAVQAIYEDLPRGVRVLGIVHSDDAEHYDNVYRHDNALDHIVAVSEEIARKLIERDSRLSQKMSTIRYGLTAPAADRIAPLIERKIAAAEPIRVVFAGRFEVFQKRIYDYVRLARQLEESMLSYELTLVGEGLEFAAVRTQLSGLVLSGSVKLPGRLSHPETQAIIAQANVLLVLSDFEGLPLSLVEGLQNGCVPIVYDMKSGIPEVIADGENGFMVPTGDVAAVAKRIGELQKDQKLRERMTHAALGTADRLSLTAEAMGRQYSAIFEELLRKV